ncbi:MAG: hypothetical protein IJ319_01645 [Bacteroidaceae bacterium]|nr:hypothetical protein [Bacteroidaceae bacterium]
MQQIMVNSKFLNSIVIFTIGILLFTGCSPSEPKLELQLKEQVIGEAFTFADYCENKYDSIYIIQPYDDEDVIWALPYQMSQELREEISFTLDDTFVRIIFIKNDTVKAYAEIGNRSAYFSTSEITNNGPKFFFEQRFILDKNRYVHIYDK